MEDGVDRSRGLCRRSDSNLERASRDHRSSSYDIELCRPPGICFILHGDQKNVEVGEDFRLLQHQIPKLARLGVCHLVGNLVCKD
jgi:hypothetical protein